MMRRSRRTGVSSSAPTTPNDDEYTTKKSSRSRTPHSKSVEKKSKMITRSASKNVSAPSKVLERKDFGSSEKKKRLGRSKSRRRVTSRSYDESPPRTFTEKPQVLIGSGPYVTKLNNVPAKDYKNESDNESGNKNQEKIVKTLPVEFGGLFGNLLLATSLPVSVILSKIAIKTKGNLIPFPKAYLRSANYYDQNVFMWTAGIVVLQLFISLLPLANLSEGLPSSDYRIYYYRFTGTINLIFGALIVAAMYHFKCPIDFILEIVTKKSIPHVAVSVLLAVIISVVLYIKAIYTKQINKSDTSNFVQKLFNGITTNPTFGPINVKLALFRYSVLMTILFNYLAIIDSLNPVNIPLCFVAGLQMFYALDKLIFEFNLLSSFYLHYEKNGFWIIVQQLLQPIINFLPIQILLVNNLPVNYVILSISSILFLLGYVCQRYCDLMKYKYETNAEFAKKSSGVKTISTLDGKRIFVKGIFSYIRYPNYLGTIIVCLALTLPVFELTLTSLQTSWPALVYPLYYILTLSHRCARVSSYCQMKYSMVWNNQFAVKWNLIPNVF